MTHTTRSYFCLGISPGGHGTTAATKTREMEELTKEELQKEEKCSLLSATKYRCQQEKGQHKEKAPGPETQKGPSPSHHRHH